MFSLNLQDVILFSVVPLVADFLAQSPVYDYLHGKVLIVESGVIKWALKIPCDCGEENDLRKT